MVSELTKSGEEDILRIMVLILVLVEDGLGGDLAAAIRSVTEAVLILVLVEDGLGGLTRAAPSPHSYPVLILVLVEDGLGDSVEPLVAAMVAS